MRDDVIRYLASENLVLGSKAAWRAWMRQIAWDWIGTFTFEFPTAMASRDALFRAMVNEASKKLFGRRAARWPDGGITWLRVEEQTRAGMPHYHALFLCPSTTDLSGVARPVMEGFWSRRCGFCRIQAIQRAEGARAYVLKQIGGGADVVLSDKFPKYDCR